MAVGRVFKKVRKGIEDKNWSYRWYANGLEFERSSRSESEAVAKKLLKKALEKVGAGALPAEDHITYNDLMLKVENDRIKHQKPLDEVRQRRRHLNSFFGGMRAMWIRTETVDQYISVRLGENAAPATIDRELALLRRGFNLAELSIKPKFKLFNPENVRRDFLDWGDFLEVRKHLPEWMADFCTVAFLTSWRQGQLATLEWRDVDTSARTMTARASTTKGGVPHCIPLVGEVWEIIQRRYNVRAGEGPGGCHGTTYPHHTTGSSLASISPYVFTYNGAPILLRGSTSPARKAWRAACEAAGFSGHYLHGLRRSGIRWMVQQAEMPIHTAMGYSGHKTTSMLQRYNIQTVEGMRRAMETATAKLPEQPTSKVRKIG